MRRRDLLFLPVAAAAVSRAQSGGDGELPLRQYQLDFEAGERTTGLGPGLHGEAFESALKSARVNSILVPAKGQSGYAYYSSDTVLKHPAPRVDLFGEVVEASKRAGLAVHYTYSLAKDLFQAQTHPEWLVAGSGGDRQILCLNTPYLDQVVADNEAIVRKYAIDGARFDALQLAPEGCSCKWCLEDRRKLALGNDVTRHNHIIAMRVEKRLSDLLKSRNPRALISFRGRPVEAIRGELSSYGYIAIDEHFDVRARYLRTLGKDIVGLTRGLREVPSQASLDFECLRFIASGAKACIVSEGGGLDAAASQKIGAAYRKLEALEPWTRGARAVADIGVLAAETALDDHVTAMLIELHQQFDMLDAGSDFAAYRLILAPDEVRPTEQLTLKLREYLDRGGALLVSGASLFDGVKFALDLGVRYEGQPAKPDGGSLGLQPGAFPDMDAKPFLLPEPGLTIAVKSGTEVLATRAASRSPVITRKDGIIYIASPMFRSNAREQKQLIAELIRMLLVKPAVLAPNLPSAAQVTMLEQRLPTGMRRVVHVLYYPQEPGLLENIRLSVRLPQHPLAVVTIPDQKPVEFVHNEFYTTFTLPRILGHQAVAFE